MVISHGGKRGQNVQLVPDIFPGLFIILCLEG